MDLFCNQWSRIGYWVYYVSERKLNSSLAVAHACRILYKESVGFVYQRHWICTTAFTRKYLHLRTTGWLVWVLVGFFFFLLYSAGNVKVLGWLSSFSPQVIQDQKTLRTEIHRLKCNQCRKNAKANSKNCHAEGKVNICAPHTPFYSQLLNQVTIYPHLSPCKSFGASVAFPAENFSDFDE